MRVKRGDLVKIISGNDKGKTGKVMKVYPKEKRIVVEGVNMKKKHVRARSQEKKGEMVLMPAPFPASRAMVVCPKCGKATRVGRRINERGVKIRVCRKCGAEI